MKSIQYRIDEILSETQDWYLNKIGRQGLVNRLISEGYSDKESIKAVEHYDRN